MFIKLFFVTLMLQEYLNYQEKANVLGLDDFINFDLIRVKDGTEDIDNDYSFIVSVNESGLIRCTGILVNSSFIVTTATCANLSNDEQSGTVLRNMSLNDGTSRIVEKIIFHPHYEMNTQNSTLLNLYNVAVLTLDSPVNENQTIDLARTITEKLVLSRAKCTAISRDISSLNETEFRTFRSYNMTLIDWDECRTESNDLLIDSNQVCAKMEGSGDICLVEGAPLICEGQVIGLFSSTQCGTNPVVFIRLDKVEDFLISQESILSEDNILSLKATINTSSEGASRGVDMIMTPTIKPLENITSTMKAVKVMTILEKSIDKITSTEKLFTVKSLEKSHSKNNSIQFNASKSQNVSSEEVGIFPSNITTTLSNEAMTSNVLSLDQEDSKEELPSLDKIKKVRDYKKLFSGRESSMGCAKSSKATTTRSPPPSLTISFIYSLTICLLGVSIGSYSLIKNVP